MKARVVRLNDVKVLGVPFGKIVEKLLKVFGVDPIMVLDHHFTRQGFNDAIQIKSIKLPLYLDQGFDSLQGNPPSGDGFQAEPAFVLRPVANSRISF
jgi:hypothetical protein